MSHPLDRWRWQVGRALPLLLIFAVIVVVGVSIWLYPKISGAFNDSNGRGSANQSEPPASNSPQPIPTESVMPVNRLTELENSVSLFIQVYYHRDASLSESNLRQQLSSMVTSSFLRQYSPKLSSESDQWVRTNDGVIEASARILGSDGSVVATRAIVPVEVTVTGEASGVSEEPYVFTIQLDMIWQQERWQVRKFS